jgi:hypothetical protein
MSNEKVSTSLPSINQSRRRVRGNFIKIRRYATFLPLDIKKSVI